MSGACLYDCRCTDHLQKGCEIYVFVYIDCASVLIFCGFPILADRKVGFNLMHRSTFMDSIFLNEILKCSWQRLASETQERKDIQFRVSAIVNPCRFGFRRLLFMQTLQEQWSFCFQLAK